MTYDHYYSTSLDELNNQQHPVSSEVVSNRALSRLHAIITEGKKLPGLSPDGCNPRSPPSWYDPKKFKHAQRLYQTYGLM